MRPTVSIVLSVALALAACSKTEPAPDPVRAVRTMTVGLDAAGGSCEYGHRSQRDGAGDGQVSAPPVNTPQDSQPDDRASRVNISRWALEHPALTRYLLVVLMALGLASYFQLGQDEDPPFTFRAMVVRAYWPGATAQQIAILIDQIEPDRERGVPTWTAIVEAAVQRCRPCTPPGSASNRRSMTGWHEPAKIPGD